jgi:hypothetical protein
MMACLERVKAHQEKMRTDLEELDPMDLEASRGKSEAVAEHQEVPNEEAIVEYRNARKQQTTDSVAR